MRPREATGLIPIRHVTNRNYASLTRLRHSTRWGRGGMAWPALRPPGIGVVAVPARGGGRGMVLGGPAVRLLAGHGGDLQVGGGHDLGFAEQVGQPLLAAEQLGLVGEVGGIGVA
jgi:hypothetical protein